MAKSNIHTDVFKIMYTDASFFPKMSIWTQNEWQHAKMGVIVNGSTGRSKSSQTADKDHPVHPCSLIRVFSVRTDYAWEKVLGRSYGDFDHFQNKQLCHFDFRLPSLLGQLWNQRISYCWSNFFSFRVNPILEELRQRISKQKVIKVDFVL